MYKGPLLGECGGGRVEEPRFAREGLSPRELRVDAEALVATLVATLVVEALAGEEHAQGERQGEQCEWWSVTSEVEPLPCSAIPAVAARPGRAPPAKPKSTGVWRTRISAGRRYTKKRGCCYTLNTSIKTELRFEFSFFSWGVPPCSQG